MFDALAARAVARELQEKIARGRIQAVLSLDPLSIGFEVYVGHARHYLFASADPTEGRIHLVNDKLRASGEPPSAFIQLLKKYADGAFVNRVEAVPRERIIRMELDHAEYGVTSLVVEVMGRYSNVILVDPNENVLDACRRVTPAMSRARPLLPRTPYMPPPPQGKSDPLMLSLEELSRELEDARGAPLWQVLVRTVAGVSPLLGRELAFRATGDADSPADPVHAAPSLAAIVAVWRAPAEPTLALEQGIPVDVAAYALTHLAETRPFESMSEALEQFFGAADSYEAVKEPLREQIQDARVRLERRRAALERELVSEAEMDRLRVIGETILAHAHEIGRGQSRLQVVDENGQKAEIPLDPQLTAVENAQKRFADYRRAKSAFAAVPERLREAGADVEFADQVLSDLRDAENRAEIDAVIQEAREARLLTEGHRPRAAAQKLRSGPRAFLSPDGFQVLAGRHARENEQLTFERAGPDDLWLHARGAAGAHVVILSRGREVPDSTVEFAARLAAYYSAQREQGRVDVVVAARRNVRRVRGRAARPGLVSVRGERTVRVSPGRPEQ